MVLVINPIYHYDLKDHVVISLIIVSNNAMSYTYEIGHARVLGYDLKDHIIISLIIVSNNAMGYTYEIGVLK